MAKWYDELLEGERDTFQQAVILPNVTRILDIHSGTRVLDIGCGQGFFSRHFAASGGQVFGVDIAAELIALAKKKPVPPYQKGSLNFAVAPAERLPSLILPHSIDVATMILCIQNIEQVAAAFHECARVLTPNGRLVIVMNHPAFRVPKATTWGWDEAQLCEYRRVDRYLSEATIKIDMHPGERSTSYTTSFHRSLQWYMKSFAKAGFCVTRLEEWISHRPGPRGRKFVATERARKEIPLFLCIEVRPYHAF